MNIHRLVARLAAVCAISNFSTAPYPTIAGNLVFDSRIEPVENIKDTVIFPIVVIYTDYERHGWLHGSNVAKDRLLTMTFELLAAQISKKGDTFIINMPVSDSELETSLDVLEAQVVEALRADNVAANCWRYLMMRYEDVISRRGATAEGGQKIAARQITVEASVPRGPTSGVVPEQIAVFLDRLETFPDYADRVGIIRGMYTGSSSMSAAERLLRSMGWTKEAGQMLGYELGDPALGVPLTDIVFPAP